MNNKKLDFFEGFIAIGSYDLFCLLSIGEECHDDAVKVGNVIWEELKNRTDYLTLNDFLNGNIDYINLYNRHILWEAREELEEKIDYDIIDEGECDFYANYSDCKFYTEKDEDEIREIILNKLIENGLCFDDLSYYTQYILNELNISENDLLVEF